MTRNDLERLNEAARKIISTAWLPKPEDLKGRTRIEWYNIACKLLNASQDAIEISEKASTSEKVN